MIWFGFIAGTMRQKQKTPPSCDPSNMIKPTAPGLSPSDSCALPAGRAAEHLSGEADCWPVSLSPASKGPLIRWRDDISVYSLWPGFKLCHGCFVTRCRAQADPPHV